MGRVGVIVNRKGHLRTTNVVNNAFAVYVLPYRSVSIASPC